VTQLDRETAIAALADHHSSQAYRPQDQYWNDRNVVNADGQYLGPYIPYIGKLYFQSKPRVIIYAIAQNLSGATDLIKAWLKTPDKGLLRHYYEEDQAIPCIHINPYDDGHLKVIAALTLSLNPGTSFKPTDTIDDLVSVTNFVKFSFYHESKDGSRKDANPPQGIYDTMWKCYSGYEIELLQPDIIVGAGNDVAAALVRGLTQNGKPNIVIKVPFPGRLNLNARWLHKGNQLVEIENYDPQPVKAEIGDLLEGTPDREGKIHKAIEMDWYYFSEMKRHLRDEIHRLA